MKDFNYKNMHWIGYITNLSKTKNVKLIISILKIAINNKINFEKLINC